MTIPRDPDGTTHAVEYYRTIAALIGQVPTTVFVTSTDWAIFAKELNEQYRGHYVNPLVLAKPGNFARAAFGSTTFVNAGTEDQEVVNVLNAESAELANFAWKRRELATGRKA